MFSVRRTHAFDHCYYHGVLFVLLRQKTGHKVLCGTFQISRFISDSNITFHISVMLSFLKIGVVQGEAKGGGLFSARSSHGQDRQNAVPRFSPGLGRHHKGYEPTHMHAHAQIFNVFGFANECFSDQLDHVKGTLTIVKRAARGLLPGCWCNP